MLSPIQLALKAAVVSAALAALSACASSGTRIVKSETKPTARKLFTKAVADTGKSIPNAARAPLRDFNFMKEGIPQILIDIKYPYKIDGPVYCDQLVEEVSGLDQVLGLAQDVSEEELSRTEETAEAASNAAQNALEDVTTGWIPYRSVIRRITGATKHERAIRKAYERGRIRRAFLKGVGGAFQCPYPARPSSVIEAMPVSILEETIQVSP